MATRARSEDRPRTAADGNPLTGAAPAEVPLSAAPLVRVVAQVRFPVIASLENPSFVAPFQEAVRRDFPVLRPEQLQTMFVTPNGPVETRATTAWRFQDVSGAWRLTLAPEFLALETTQYTSRSEFIHRFGQSLEALRVHIDPVAERLGVRYVSRVVGPNLDDISELVRPQVSGVLSTALAGDVLHALSESVFRLSDEAGLLKARWGRVPPHGTVDHAVLEPLDEPSWILDIDAFQVFATLQPLDVEALAAQTRSFAERIYSVFRWAVNDEFLRRYGGTP